MVIKVSQSQGPRKGRWKEGLQSNIEYDENQCRRGTKVIHRFIPVKTNHVNTVEIRLNLYKLCFN